VDDLPLSTAGGSLAAFSGPRFAGRWSRFFYPLPIAVGLAVVAVLSFLSGGYIFSRTAPVVVVVLALAIVSVWLAPSRLRLSGPVLAGLVAFALFALWEGLSILWSIGPDLSWMAFDVTLLYVVAACVLGTAPVGPGRLRLAGYGAVVAVAPAAVYALLGKVLPDVVTDAHMYARLSAPLGYWNVLAIMMVMAALPALEGASRRGLPVAARGAFAGALAVFLCTLFFTFSRGGTLALALALVVYFALTNERLQGVLSLTLAALPEAAALYHARHLHTLFTATTDNALRTAQGHSFGRTLIVAVAVTIAAQVAAAVLTRHAPLAGRRRVLVGAVVLAAVVAVVAVGVLAYAARNGGFGGIEHRVVRQFSSSDTSGNLNSSSAGRLLSLGNDGRIPMVREGLRSFAHHPLAGTGAGTFRFINFLYRPSASYVVKDAHNQWINVLSELGIVGLALFVLALGGLLVAALRPVGRVARDADRGLLAALQAAAVAFVVHITIDWDWDMAAAALLFLVFVCVAAGYVQGRRGSPSSVVHATGDDQPAAAGRGEVGDGLPSPERDEAEAASPSRAGRRGTRRPADRSGIRLPFGLASRALASGVLVLIALSVVVPYLSERALSQAIVLAGRGQLAGAVTQAERAHHLDPLAVDPLFTLAQVEQQQGKAGVALATLDRAAHLQPRNYATWYELGVMQLAVLGQRSQAAASLRRALALNHDDTLSASELASALAPQAAP
jgi:O-antigen ligase